ncbi:MAG: response regulator [Oscillospiraceae bacterium]|jgi:PAS domain S-box-containing protein|nr:response regulator [Oscillospiraceae bacterium]
MHEDNYLIENIIHLTNLLQRYGLEVCQLTDSEVQKKLVPLLGPQEFYAAFGMLRFMDEMPGGFLLYHAGGGEELIYANRALLRIFRCDTMAELRAHTGNTFRGIVHPEDLEEVEKSIWDQINSSRYDLDYVEYRIICRDGAVRWIEDYGHFVRGRDGRDIFYVFLGDATEKHHRILAEKEMLISESNQEKQRYQDLIQEYDRERALINQEYLRRLEVIQGLSINYESIFYSDLNEDQILPYRLSGRCLPLFDKISQPQGLSVFLRSYAEAWVHPEDREMFLKTLSQAYMRDRLADNKTFYINYRVLDGGEVRYLQLRVVNVGGGEGRRPAQIVIGSRRVDEELEREMEQKHLLADALVNANQAIRAKDTFLSNMSHDIRTPLNAIFGFTTLARQSIGNPEEVCGYLERIEASSQQLLDQLNQVLELARWNSSERSGSPEASCDICQLFRDIFDRLYPQTVDKNLAFTLDCSDVLHPIVCCDQERLKQLVLYLTNNAIAYTKAGGKVMLTVAEVRQFGQFSDFQLKVEDTGIGISREFLDHIFEPFARERNTTMSGISGIGLGLTIVKSIVDAMGGAISVDSEVGRGSAFTVTLRLRLPDSPKDAPPEEITDAAGAAEDDFKGLRILLVEDNEINLEIETEILKELDFSVDTAVNGKLAMEKIAGSAPGEYDLVLMDIQMPVMDGWQAAREIRQLNNPVPIIALSANVFESDVRKSMESGMNAHLPKPLDVEQLLETIRKVR